MAETEGRDRLAPSRLLSRDETLRRLPGVRKDGLSGAVSYADGQFDDTRYCLALIRTFRDHGGDALTIVDSPDDLLEVDQAPGAP